MSRAELELLLSLDGASFEMASGVIVEFAVRRTHPSRQRPHGILYALLAIEEGWRALDKI